VDEKIGARISGSKVSGKVRSAGHDWSLHWRKWGPVPGFFGILGQIDHNRWKRTEMIAKTERQLHELCRRILSAAGADEVNAGLVADHLVRANLSGDDGHGVWHIPLYVEAIQDGFLVPTAKPRVIGESEHQIVVGGNWTFGHVAAAFAMEKAIAMAREQGMAVVGLVQSHHIGRVAHYAEMAASAGMIAIVADGSYGSVYPAAADGDAKAKPIAMGYPAGEDGTLMFEFATAALSGVGMLDAKDEPSTDGGINGAESSLGGHKGFALMMAIEYFGRLLQEGNSLSFGDAGGSGRGVGMIVLRADLFHEGSDRPGAVDRDRLGLAVEQVGPSGTGEAAVRRRRQREGVPVADEIWKSLEEVADSLGVEGV
jgi:uncharacterized oxidoreductase